jgi:uncharacterized protein YycO
VLEYIRRQLIRLVGSISPIVAKIHSPWSHKKITAKDYRSFTGLGLPAGTVLLSRTDGEFGNLFIPGFWGHAAIYDGDRTVVEAVGAGVVETDLVEFLMKKDYVRALVPTFASREQMDAAYRRARTQKGKPYDYRFQTSDVSSWYCSELIQWAYVKEVPGMEFASRETLGVVTVTPEDLAKASKHWRVWWRSAGDKL